jgi:NADPH:quinone reductase-like Zn-dependent oxidoreductase
MKAYRIEKQFGIDHLEPVELPDPQPGPGDVLVRVKAVSLNARDLRMVLGEYNPRQKLPLIPCSDGAGEVIAVGAAVRDLKPGDRVTSVFASGWLSGDPTRQKLASTLGGPVDGMLTELRALPEGALLRVPTHLSFEEAATLPCAAVTAWRALVTEGHVKAGDTVLVQGTGGVAIFGLQIARLLGARVIAISSSDQKLVRARELGAAHGINYRTTPDWHKEAKALTDRVGVDHILDVGGASTLERSLMAVRMGGQISVIGVLGGAQGPINLIPILMQNVRLQGVLVGTRDDFEAMNRAFELHQLRPVVDRVFEYGEARAAFDHLASGSHFGKVVVRI